MEEPTMSKVIIPEHTVYKPHTEELAEIIAEIKTFMMQNLPEEKVYHNVDHTFHPKLGVLAVADAHARSLGLGDLDRFVLGIRSAAHDAGHAIAPYTGAEHEERSAEYITQLLTDKGYSSTFASRVAEGVMPTKVDFGLDTPLTSPETLLEQILCDADLDNLGRDDHQYMKFSPELVPYGFIAQTDLVRREEGKKDLKQWFGSTKYLMTKHGSFYTEPAIALRNKGQENNLMLVDAYLANHAEAERYIHQFLDAE